MIALLLVAASLNPLAAQDAPKVFTSYEMGVTFNYPSTWTLATEKGSTRGQFPIEGSPEQATLEIYPANFKSDIDIWQATQLNISQQMKREVLKQWQEEIMGVPLLLTKAQGIEGGRVLTQLSGLVYSATPRKMVFRLMAPPADFDKAEFAWRTVLQSLRTVDGAVPKAEDPNRKVTEEDLKPISKPPKRTVWSAPTKAAAAPVKGTVSVDVTAGGTALKLLAPEGWAFESAEGTVTIKHAASGLSATVAVSSILDSPAPGLALMNLTAKTLDSYSRVDSRVEKGPLESRSGGTISYVWRQGAATDAAERYLERARVATPA